MVARLFFWWWVTLASGQVVEDPTKLFLTEEP